MPSVEPNALLDEWERRLSRAVDGHYDAARRFERGSRYLVLAALGMSFTATVLTAAVLSATKPGGSIRTAAVVAAGLASLLGLLQNQLNLSVRANQHRMSAAGFSDIRRSLETLRTTRCELDINGPTFAELISRYRLVSSSAPIIPGKSFHHALGLFGPVHAVTGSERAADPNADRIA